MNLLSFKDRILCTTEGNSDTFINTPTLYSFVNSGSNSASLGYARYLKNRKNIYCQTTSKDFVLYYFYDYHSASSWFCPKKDKLIFSNNLGARVLFFKKA